MSKKRMTPRPIKAAAKMILVRSYLNVLSIMPGLIAAGLFGGMVFMFMMVMADLACLDAQSFLVVTE